MSAQLRGDLANLWAVGGEQVAHTAVQESRGYYQFCPGCCWALTGKFSTCPRCKADLRTIICTYCGGSIPVGLEVCLRCTAPLA